MFVDTHCHLTMLEAEPGGIPAVLDAAKKEGVEKIITIGTTLYDSISSTEIAKKHAGVFASVGIHPCDANELWEDAFVTIKKLLEKKEENKIIAIGETGLDFFHKPFDKQRQIEVFTAHIEASIAHGLPLVIHTRDSAEEMLKVLEPYKNSVRGVTHCFVQKKEIADVLLEWGFYVGIGGPLSYKKNEWLRELFAEIPLERILLETDAPFLPPQQFRGKTNYPAYIPMTAQVIAEIKNIELAHVERVTTQNVYDLFGV